jgi:hypothetical protein
LLCLLAHHTRDAPIKEDFQRLIGEGVQTVGPETMPSIKNRIREEIMQAESKSLGSDMKADYEQQSTPLTLTPASMNEKLVRFDVPEKSQYIY